MKFLFPLLILFTSLSYGQSLSKEERQRILDAKKQGINTVDSLETKVVYKSKAFLNAKNFKLEKHRLSGVYEVEKKTKEELYSLINRWISINYNSANNVIQMNDKESGTIIVKGINKVRYKSNIDVRYLKEDVYLIFRHLIEINIKNGRFRVIFTPLNIDNDSDIIYGVDNMVVFEAINLVEVKDEDLIRFNKQFDDYLRGAYLLGKSRRDKLKPMTKQRFNELTEVLRQDIIILLTSLELAVNDEGRDDW